MICRQEGCNGDCLLPAVGPEWTWIGPHFRAPAGWTNWTDWVQVGVWSWFACRGCGIHHAFLLLSSIEDILDRGQIKPERIKLLAGIQAKPEKEN